MLFDLQTGRRKTVVKVVYSLLALLMGGSLVLFGIGSDAPGGILDALGLGGDDDDANPQYEQQIDDARSALETDPKSQQAMLDLIRYLDLSAREGVSQDPNTGATSLTEDARAQYEEAVATWEDYLATKPAPPDVGAAVSASLAYVYLLDAGGAARAQEIVAKDQKSATAYFTLAQYLYADFQFKKGDAAAEQAIAASDPSTRPGIRKNLEAIAEAQRQRQKDIEKQAEQGGPEAGEGQLNDPFGGLEGGSTAPGVPPTPAP